MRAPRCGGCNQVLTGKFIRTPEGTPYHKECFVCNSCGNSVEAGYVLRDNVPYCANCARTSSSAPVANKPAPVARQGLC